MSVAALKSRSRLFGLSAQVQLRRFILAYRFDPDQPRDERGRWTESDGESTDPLADVVEPTVGSIVAIAAKLNLAARSDGYPTCLDLCSPLLERPLPPWNDKNTWSFHKT